MAIYAIAAKIHLISGVTVYGVDCFEAKDKDGALQDAQNFFLACPENTACSWEFDTKIAMASAVVGVELAFIGVLDEVHPDNLGLVSFMAAQKELPVDEALCEGSSPFDES
jgi:hypothetical protein